MTESLLAACYCGHMAVPRGGYGLVRYDDDRPDRHHYRAPRQCDPPADWHEQLAEVRRLLADAEDKAEDYARRLRTTDATQAGLNRQVRTLTRERDQVRKHLSTRSDERDRLLADMAGLRFQVDELSAEVVRLRQGPFTTTRTPARPEDPEARTGILRPVGFPPPTFHPEPSELTRTWVKQTLATALRESAGEESPSSLLAARMLATAERLDSRS